MEMLSRIWFCDLELDFRSLVFRAMLSSNMKERQTGRIDLTDWSLKTGQDLLSFLYSGRVKPDADLTKLLVVADRYDFQELKEMTSEALKTKIRDENCLDLLMLAHLHHAERLKDAALVHIRLRSKALFKTTGWEEKFNGYSSLLTEIIKAVTK